MGSGVGSFAFWRISGAGVGDSVDEAGVQDTTIAVLTYQKAISRGLGTSFEV